MSVDMEITDLCKVPLDEFVDFFESRGVVELALMFLEWKQTLIKSPLPLTVPRLQDFVVKSTLPSTLPAGSL